MGLFCMHCAWIYGHGSDVPDIIHQAACPNEGFGLRHPDGFDPAEARAALPKGGEWRSARHIVETLRVFRVVNGATGGADMPPGERLWYEVRAISDGGSYPGEITLRQAYEMGGGKAWLLNPYENRDAAEVRIETPVERAARLGKLWVSGAHGEAWPR